MPKEKNNQRAKNNIEIAKEILYGPIKKNQEKLLKFLEGKKFVDDEAAGCIMDVITTSMPSLKGVLDKYNINPKDMIRFQPVPEMCQSEREKKKVSLKQIALSLKVPQYKLRNIESSSIKDIKADILESYIDYLGLRDRFESWKKNNSDVYSRLLKTKC